MNIAYIGLGSNMQLPKHQIESAIESIRKVKSTRILKLSSFYKTKPVGPKNQDDYVNVVVKIETGLMPLELLDCMQEIENQHGRIRSERWGPRTLDLDILMFGNELIKEHRLTIPHPQIENRSFVLIPLAEIEPNCLIPGKGLISNLLKKVDQEDIELLK